VSAESFAHVGTWIFDLDNTLYPAECDLFSQVDARMTDFIVRRLGLDREAANTLRLHYYLTLGTTLAGLMRDHAVDPRDFLGHVHDIDFSAVAPAPELRRAIDALPGRKFVFTNGARDYAAKVADRLGLTGCFEDVFDICAGGYVPKPNPAAYDAMLKAHRIAPESAAMFEDLPQNLVAPHALGVRTVLVRSACMPVDAGPYADRIDFETGDLTKFLNDVKPTRARHHAA
jgi:putative hydrolase of the HAD superfamily